MKIRYPILNCIFYKKYSHNLASLCAYLVAQKVVAFHRQDFVKYRSLQKKGQATRFLVKLHDKAALKLNKNGVG